MQVWSHTQGAFPLRGDPATVSAMPEAKVDVVHMPGSGCYGRNGADDAALDAALLARAVKDRPVKLQWMRDDEFTSSQFGPAMAISVSAALDAKNRIVDWDYEVWSNSPAMRPGQPGVCMAHVGDLQAVTAAAYSAALWRWRPQRAARVRFAAPKDREPPVAGCTDPKQFGANAGSHGNVFAIESFMDELAAMAGVDPVEFRLDHLRDPRARQVIEDVVRRSAWTPPAKAWADGGETVARGRGFAYSRYKNMQTYAAVVAEVEVDRANGVLRVLKVFVTVDTGRIVNPDGVANQIEGGILQCISWTLKEQVRFDRERVLTHSWMDYPTMTFSEMPKVELAMIDRPHEPSLGAGEGALGPAAAAVANAFANATGRRIRDLPMTPERVKSVWA